MTPGDSVSNQPIEDREATPPRSRFDSLVWPRWLPTRARLPLIAQIAGAFALVAAVTMPQWTVGDPAPAGPSVGSPVSPASPVSPVSPASPASPASPVSPASPAPPAEPLRPAHLNLDLRHNFRSVDLSVTVDNKRVLDTKLEGAGKKFGVFGRREERSFTRTLDLEPGVRVVRLQVKSAAEKFQHSRVERFELGPASVATMRVEIEKAGLSVIADRPAPPPQPAIAADRAPAPVLPPAHASQAAQAAAQAVQEAQEASALAALYRSLRSILITIAGLVGSTATAFVVQEFLKQRKVVDFNKGAGSPENQAARILRRRRERRARRDSDIEVDVGLS